MAVAGKIRRWPGLRADSGMRFEKVRGRPAIVRLGRASPPPKRDTVASKTLGDANGDGVRFDGAPGGSGVRGAKSALADRRPVHRRFRGGGRRRPPAGGAVGIGGGARRPAHPAVTRRERDAYPGRPGPPPTAPPPPSDSPILSASACKVWRRSDVALGVGTSGKRSGRRTRGSSDRRGFGRPGFTLRSLRCALVNRNSMFGSYNVSRHAQRRTFSLQRSIFA